MSEGAFSSLPHAQGGELPCLRPTTHSGMAQLGSRQAGSRTRVLIGGVVRKSRRPVLLMNVHAKNLNKILANRIRRCRKRVITSSSLWCQQQGDGLVFVDPVTDEIILLDQEEKGESSRQILERH